MDGLEQVLELRGGLKSLNSFVAIFVFWYCSFPLRLHHYLLRGNELNKKQDGHCRLGSLRHQTAFPDSC